MAVTRSKDPLVWIDCEVCPPRQSTDTRLTDSFQMTGLNPEADSIMSLCCFITDSQLRLLDTKGWDATIHHPKARLDSMSEWCTRVHGASGLTAACISSTTTHHLAAEGLVAYVKRYIPEPRVGLLAGNSIHQDKAFLSKEPYDKVLQHLHYRILDVSSLKEAVRRWAPSEVLEGAPKKKTLHDAREDILESIEEAKYYKETIFGAVKEEARK
jgi:oligoribonuclease